MKLIKISKAEIDQTREVPGLLSCRMAYEIKSGSGQMQYTGPKFSPEMWHQVMSFFRWTFKEMQSESQVRLYVNPGQGRWGAWAFPQAARTGLSARELVVKETADQARERFKSWKTEPSEDWIYFCTVHHHCSAEAFQSGTDENNEKNQDGLHITMGRMDDERHDLHARFYLGGNCFEPDLSAFWPVDSMLTRMVPEEVLDAVARHQMCQRVTVDFPDAWRANLVEVQRERITREEQEFLMPFARQPEVGYGICVERTIEDIMHQGELAAITEPEFVATLEELCDHPASRIILRTCFEHGIQPEDLLEEMKHYEFS